jgi:quinol monooxygenase YgiN
MNVTLLMRIQLKNFDTWLNPDADAVAKMMKEQGALAMNLLRSQDNPNEVIAVMEFPDRKTLNAYQAWYDAAAAEWLKAFPGSEQKIVEYWAGQTVPSHSRTL